MKTKKTITSKEIELFFSSSINYLSKSMGTCKVSISKGLIEFDEIALNILHFDTLSPAVSYSIKDKSFDDVFSKSITLCNNKPISEKTDYTFTLSIMNQPQEFGYKLAPIDDDNYHLYILSYEVLNKTEKEIGIMNSIIERGTSIFKGSTWWIDYDKHTRHFYQSDTGPKLLGMEPNPDKLYSTRVFQGFREKARHVSEFFDECIQVESEMYERVRNNETDFFGGRTPAYTIDEEIVWVEAYGVCLLRYADGSPRLFVAIDIYLSDIFETANQLQILNNLMEVGLINSNVGVWYYQKYYLEGRYYFTKSHRELMNMSEDYSNDNVMEVLERHFSKIISHTPEYKTQLTTWRTTHRKVFTGEIDSYSVLIPNHINKENPQWIELRGRVIERDQDGNVVLFVGVSVDVTELTLQNIELRKLREQNEKLQLAEKLAIKAGNVLVWYQDFNLIKGNHYIFGNDMFTEKLGVNRDAQGFLLLNSLRRTIVKDDKKSKQMSKKFISELNNIYSKKKASFKNLLVKHKNPVTNQIYYFEHAVEVEEYNEDGSLKLVGGFMLDVTENITKQEAIEYLANYDILTGLHNRNFFDRFIKSENLPQDYSVLIFDLDGLKLINDAFGHLEGDKVIQQLASNLKELFDGSECIARIGGDEFVIITENINGQDVTDRVNILEKVVEEYNKYHPIEMSVSKGGKIVKNNDLTFEKAFTHAENLMYRRKLNNRSSRKSQALESIMETLNQKTEETKEHSDRLRTLAVKTLQDMGHTRSSEIEDMELLCRVHDIGKITIPDAILHKPGKLSDDEFEIIKRHSEAGYKIIKNITDSDFISEGVLYHHEWFNGNGYPQGIKGEDIPLFARILSVADAYDAMTSERIYKKAKSHDEAIEEINKFSGKQFDPKVVRSFLRSCFENN